MECDGDGMGRAGRGEIDARYGAGGGDAAAVDNDLVGGGDQPRAGGEVAGFRQAASPIGDVGDGAGGVDGGAKRRDAGGHGPDHAALREIDDSGLIVVNQRDHGQAFRRQRHRAGDVFAEVVRNDFEALFTGGPQADFALLRAGNVSAAGLRIEPDALQAGGAAGLELGEHAVVFPVEAEHAPGVQHPELLFRGAEGESLDAALKDGLHAGRRYGLARCDHAGVGDGAHGPFGHLGAGREGEGES